MRIKEAREKRGITQRELAEELGVDQSAISFWEAGKTHPRASMLPRLTKALGCSLDELFAEKEERV